ncbi:hypothetical protein GCM10017044_09610 [Kordiimonas sediminis]|uniref:Type II secretion system protein J n=1 Tax=Kordiimonas sediminis TaxID=1735581 RepID=A0A919AMR2_9PROT|nr:type II secretion system minor pseudopilin GspJ [Kordiimonas sediminis]GHF17315.1 hypothetical protein GCM10017044_09610 [Kordiimonas sediminis]
MTTGPANKLCQCDEGFSLVEVLVGVMLLSLVSIVGASLLYGHEEARVRAQNVTADMQALVSFRAVLDDDLRHIAKRPARDSQGNQDRRFFVGGAVADNLLLSFVRTSHTASEMDKRLPAVQHVTYALVDNRFVRTITRRPDAVDEADLISSVLLSDIRDVRVRFKKGSQWFSDWTATLGAAEEIPDLVELTVTHEQTGRKSVHLIGAEVIGL